jgi:hypothetical protein
MHALLFFLHISDLPHDFYLTRPITFCGSREDGGGGRRQTPQMTSRSKPTVYICNYLDCDY